MSFPSLPQRVVCLVLFGMVLMVALDDDPVAAQPKMLSSESHVSLITILPGDPVYTFAGHSAFRVHDPIRGIDRLYNYGTFNFNDPLFIPKFTYGYLRYFLSVTRYPPTVRTYQQEGRPVISQRLNLTQSQRSRLYAFLEQNARPENRYYQYNFFYDNCSTRLRDALKQTLGPQIDFSDAPAPDKSFRRLLDPYVASRPLLDLGFDLGLGLPADRIATASQGMFLPDYLMRAFDKASVSIRGETHPLVTRTDTVQWVPGYDATEATFDWPVLASVFFLLLVLTWTGWQAMTNRTPTGRGDAVLFSILGFAGLVICYLWFVATYAVTDNNLNLLWAWPTHLFAAAMLVKRPNSDRLRIYLGATAAAGLAFAVGWPLWPQNFHVAVLPFVLGVSVRAGWWALLSTGTVSPSRTPQQGRVYASS